MGLYLAIADHLAARLQTAVTLTSSTSRSGPAPGTFDPFGASEVDIGFVCAPSLFWLEEQKSAELLGVAPVHADPRNGGRPVYFAELVVAQSSRVDRLEALRGARFVYNDDVSLSGYFGVLERLSDLGHGPDFFGSLSSAGSHLSSIEQVASGHADLASVDSNVLELVRERDPALAERVRVLETLGPFAVQPVVARIGLDPELRAAAARALAEMHETPAGRSVLGHHHIRCFAPVERAAYRRERERLCAAGAWLLRS
jgi:ABC-type phosphate/phosphonate transport system substrate-binding protein